jgi:hypothetical protein
MATNDRPAPRPARQASREDDENAAVWAFLWTLFAFKMITVALLLYHLRSAASDAVILATTWYWFPLLGVLGAAPLAFRYRLRKARARREALLRSEWMLDESASRQVGESASGRGGRRRVDRR